MIYGSALHAAVSEFHKRHARGDVMSEEQLFASFEAAWTNDGFLSREHEEARLEAGRQALGGSATSSCDRGRDPAWVEREFSFFLDGDKVRGRFDRVDITPRDPDEPVPACWTTGTRRAARTSSSRRFDLWPERVVITDYKSSDVRDPAKARQRAKDSLQLTIYAMAYEAMTGRCRTPWRSSSSTRGSVGPARRSTQAGGEGARDDRTAARGIRAREFQARPTTCRAARAFREICPPAPSADRDRARRRGSLGGRCRAGGRARGAIVEADNLELLAALPDDPSTCATPTRRSGRATRSGWSGSARGTARGAARLRRVEYRYEVVSDHAYDGLTLDAHLAAVRARVEAIHRVLAPHGSLYLHCDWRTAHHVRLLLDDVFGARRFLNELVRAYDYGGRPRDRRPRKHDTILWYARGDRWLFDREAIDRVPYMAPGLVGPRRPPAASCRRTCGG